MQTLYLNKNKKWIVSALVVVGLSLSACTPAAAPVTHEKPYKLDAIEGSKVKKVTLTEKAAKRIGIETIQVSEVQQVRTRRLGGEVVGSTSPNAPAATDGSVWVRVSVNTSDLNAIDRSKPARVVPLEADDDDDVNETGAEAEIDDAAEPANAPDDDDAPVYYAVKSKGHGLAIGQRTRVEVPLQGNASALKLIPYSAVIYDTHGDAWAYTNPSALVFVRQLIKIEYIQGNTAYLSDGPAVGTAIVTSGVAELYGSETGVGK
jgi:hypothetical protein